MIQIKKILLPTDFSVCSEHAALYATSLALEYEAEVYVLHVIERLTHPAFYEVISTNQEDIYQTIEKLSQEEITGVIKEEVREKLEIHNIIRHGVPFVEIIAAARECEADLIVMGTHGRTGVSHALLGSTAEKVVRKAPCPVLVVKHPEHEFVMP